MNDIAADFFANTTSPRQTAIDFLVVRHGVPITALCRDGDGQGCIVGAAHVTVDRRLFEFAEPDEVDAKSVLVFVARDRWGDPRDLVAWQPRENWIAAHYGRVALLGEHDIDAPRILKSLVVHRDVLSWLRANRTGVVVVDKKRAWRSLEGMTVAAESVEHGLDLRKILSPPPPRIVVPTVAERSAA